MKRILITIKGSVQGVGFRPFVYRLATSLQLTGHVKNCSIGVMIDVQGSEGAIGRFQKELVEKKPEGAVFTDIRCEGAPLLKKSDGFEISLSENGEKIALALLPDTAICDQCLKELKDPTNRRYRYPFIHCVACGPRFTLFRKMPFDRAHTSMIDFSMCEDCLKEYRDPGNRRFFSQTNCCPHCGPKLALFDAKGRLLSERNEAIDATARALLDGKIIALKNTGGFLLLVDATNQAAVERLRKLKRRAKKPFALLMPSLEKIKEVVELNETATELLCSPAAPIVLLNKLDTKNERDAGRNPSLSREGQGQDKKSVEKSLTIEESPLCQGGVLQIASLVAPSSPYFGVMLPHNAIHHLLFQKIDRPLVATSGNRSGNPICISEEEAFSQLSDVADLFLVHNRKIEHRLDDSIVHVILDKPMVLRRARGYIPYAISLPDEFPVDTIAGGAHQKSSFALAKEKSLYVSQHIGDLEGSLMCEAFDREVEKWEELLHFDPKAALSDKHPDYYTSRYLSRRDITTKNIQHHLSHVMAGMIDSQIKPPFLAIAWDGTGLGDDQTIWGGECFLVSEKSFSRFATLLPFKLPGGELAVREPRRSALGILENVGSSLFDDWLEIAFSQEELRTLRKALLRGINSPITSSVGRLFDAVSALLDLCLICDFEAEGGLALEEEARKAKRHLPDYQLDMNFSNEKKLWFMDWRSLIWKIAQDKRKNVAISDIAFSFHQALSDGIVKVAKIAKEPSVLLTGGVMQNKLLLETSILSLEKAGFKPYIHRHIPPNDGGVAVGQIIAEKWSCRCV